VTRACEASLEDCGLLVVGHGTADPVGAGECRRVAELIAATVGPAVPVELGFLELLEPTIDMAVDRLAARGCPRFIAAPLLLFTAGHALRDVPEAVAAAARARGMQVRQSAALGLHPDIVTLSARRRAEAIAGLPPVEPADAVLLMVGRGASDPTALLQLQEFSAASTAGDRAVAGWHVGFGFCAAARPTLDEAVAAACDAGRGRVRRIVVQPHLLFRGHVEEQVSAAVGRGRAMRPDIEWLQVPRLGGDELVARAVVGRAREAGEAWNADAEATGKTVSPSPS
jgi:sirohydrochlorin ferrochelatase